MNEGSRRLGYKRCVNKQSFDFDIYINHAMTHIYELAAQHPGGIPAIGPRDGYESVIQAKSIFHDNHVR